MTILRNVESNKRSSYFNIAIDCLWKREFNNNIDPGFSLFGNCYSCRLWKIYVRYIRNEGYSESKLAWEIKCARYRQYKPYIVNFCSIYTLDEYAKKKKIEFQFISRVV